MESAVRVDRRRQALRVRVACNIHPVARPAFPEMRRSQQSVHRFFVSLRRCICEERLSLLRSGRKACEVDRDAPQQRGFWCLRRGCQTLGLHCRQHETVDRVARPRLRFHLGRRRFHDGLERPVLFRQLRIRAGRLARARIKRTALDPLGEHVHLFGGKALAIRWHLEIRIGVRHGLDDQTFFRRPCNQRGAGTAALKHPRSGLHREPPLGLVLGRTVAFQTVRLQQRTHGFLKKLKLCGIDCVCGRGSVWIS